MADDMGFGDLGCHGNPKIKTPHLDAFAKQSTRLTNYYHSPVCTPTRASLMTGRYNYRTGAIDTAYGRAMMHPDEVTLAEMLGKAGYRTGIFGKWHLGDNYPLRAMDQGFAESLVHKGGGIGQPSDPPDGSSYFDPMLLHNGTFKRFKGYCSDVYTDHAMDFIAKSGGKPFFVYLPFNAPHAPLQAPDQEYQAYKAMNFTAKDFPHAGNPIAAKFDPDTTAKIYAMVENIDQNVGRLLKKLDELKLAENTIVIFTTDNGPQQPRYNAGLRGLKGSVYEGGIRVPFYVRWPGKLEAGKQLDAIAAHIDVAPTLLEACAVKRPDNVRFDGVSLWSHLRGGPAPTGRTLFFQWHRGDEPVLHRAIAVRTQRWKLVQMEGAAAKPLKEPRYELFDIPADPYEQKDVAKANPDIVRELLKEYEVWFKDVSGTRGYAPPRIVVGTKHENPTVFTRQDWRGPRAMWNPKDLGHWEVEVAESGTYEVKLLFPPLEQDGEAGLSLGNVGVKGIALKKGAREATMTLKNVSRGPARLEPWLGVGDTKWGPLYVEVRRLE
jgi:arylsulfatase A-like enzyme